MWEGGWEFLRYMSNIQLCRFSVLSFFTFNECLVYKLMKFAEMMDLFL